MLHNIFHKFFFDVTIIFTVFLYQLNTINLTLFSVKILKNGIGITTFVHHYNDELKPETTIYIPIDTSWFNETAGIHVSDEVRFFIDFRRAEELIVTNKNFRDNDMDQIRIRDVILLVTYLPEAVPYKLTKSVHHGGTELVNHLCGKYQIYWMQPIKEMYWGIRNENYITGKQFMYYTDTWNEDD